MKEVTALKLASFSDGVGYLILALFISNLLFKSRHLDREESSDKIVAIWHLLEEELFLPVLTYTGEKLRKQILQKLRKRVQ